MEHVTYPKIPVTRQAAGAHVGGQWVATEKLHGAQLVVGFDGRQVRVGKRREWLAPEEPFFGWQLLRGNLEAVARLALGDGVSVRVYGELYGGAYPHPDVPAVPGMNPVQTGIWYHPAVRFAVFDVLRCMTPDDPGVFRPYAELVPLADAAGVDVVPLLGRGTRRELDRLPTRFPTGMPRRLGLPELGGNAAEGLVLRPDTPAGPERPIVKRKIEEFDEARFGEAVPTDPRRFVPAAQLTEVAAPLLNAARLASARSKLGAVSEDLLVQEMVLDVLVDLADALPVAVSALTPGEHSDLAERLVERARGLI